MRFQFMQRESGRARQPAADAVGAVTAAAQFVTVDVLS